MLLCDGAGCGRACHLGCMGLAMADAPPGDWLCGACWAAGSAPPAPGGQAAPGPAAGQPPLPSWADGRSQRLILEQRSAQRGSRVPVPMQQWDSRYLADAPAHLPAWLHGRLADSSHCTLQSQRGQFRLYLQLASMPQAATAGQLAHQLACWVMGRAENGFKFSTIELGIYAVADEAVRACGWRGLAQDVQLRDALAVAKRCGRETGGPLRWRARCGRRLHCALPQHCPDLAHVGYACRAQHQGRRQAS